MKIANLLKLPIINTKSPNVKGGDTNVTMGLEPNKKLS